VPGYEHEPWNGLFAPAGIPKPVLAKISGEVMRVVHEADVKKVFETDGATPVGNKPQEFAVVLKSEIEKWRKVAKAANIKLE
jgi:tripartite-type tricarboxylate transporter receptor subunit TctC